MKTSEKLLLIFGVIFLGLNYLFHLPPPAKFWLQIFSVLFVLFFLAAFFLTRFYFPEKVHKKKLFIILSVILLSAIIYLLFFKTIVQFEDKKAIKGYVLTKDYSKFCKGKGMEAPDCESYLIKTLLPTDELIKDAREVWTDRSVLVNEVIFELAYVLLLVSSILMLSLLLAPLISKNKTVIPPIQGIYASVPGETFSQNENNAKVIYFSYAWGDEKEKNGSREKIVNDLYSSLEQHRFSLKRDKMDLGYKGLISEFMNEIGKGRVVIIVISDKYLKSPYCMFEFYEVWRNAKFEKQILLEKIYPLKTENIKLDSPEILNEYLQYWIELEAKWKGLIQGKLDNIGKEAFETYERIKKILDNFSSLAIIIQDINLLTKELLSENDFEIIKEAIERRFSK